MIPEEFMHWPVADFVTYVLTVMDVGDERDRLEIAKVVLDIGLWTT